MQCDVVEVIQPDEADVSNDTHHLYFVREDIAKDKHYHVDWQHYLEALPKI